MCVCMAQKKPVEVYHPVKVKIPDEPVQSAIATEPLPRDTDEPVQLFELVETVEPVQLVETVEPVQLIETIEPVQLAESAHHEAPPINIIISKNTEGENLRLFIHLIVIFFMFGLLYKEQQNNRNTQYLERL